jgi:flagellum-specific ATP synthase
MAHSGMDVVLVIDSLTRFAAAWREIALAAGEAPAHRGFPPSLGPALARLIERAGARVRGSLTGVYGVLVDGDDPREPVADTVRALTDGHVVLSRKLADAGRFPAVDVLRSVSRLAAAVTAPPEQRDAATLRAALATLEEAQDLLAVGAYRPGADAALDAALAVRSDIETLLFGGEDRRAYGAFRSIAAQLRSFAAKHDA